MDNLEDVLEIHRRSTLTTYGTRTSKNPSKPPSATADCQDSSDTIAKKVNNVSTIIKIRGFGVHGCDFSHHSWTCIKENTNIVMQLIHLLQVKLYWRHSAAGQSVQFENTPFSIVA